MKNNIFKSLTLLIALISFTPVTAKAEKWGVLGGVQRYGWEDERSNPIIEDAKFSPVFGIALYPWSQPIEVDILYTTKTIAEGYETNSLQFPIFYRADIFKELKLGVGAFFDYDLEDETYGKQKLDIGLAGSLQYQIPFGKGFLVLDARYLHGMTDLPGKSNYVTLLAGFILK